MQEHYGGCGCERPFPRRTTMRTGKFAGFTVLARVASAFLACWLVAPTVHAAASREPVTITYLGNAGWQIEAAHQIILVDPYLSEFGPGPDENDPDPILVPDQAQIDARIHHADYILITHGHPDHMLDAPYISNKTGAFEGFSLRILPSIHSPLFYKRYNNDPKYTGNTPAALKAPLHESAYVEGGSLAYLLRIAGHRIFIHGSMNYIENEIQGLRPDIALIGAGKSRTENYDYAGRIMRALGHPPVVLPQHWVHGNPISAAALDNVRQFAAEIKAVSPATKVVIPEYFKAMQFR
jgi:L-ascorbate metabolism protein UlaG (beta-lactamase superfamily)